MRRVHIKSYGCQMNVYDAERMADLLAREGYVETPEAEGADLVILNTCHIREKASEKVFSELGRLRRLKEARTAAGAEARIVVAGCVAQAEGAEIQRRAPQVDVVVGPQSYHRLPALLREAANGPAVDTEFPQDDKFDSLPAPAPQRIAARGPAAFLTVQEGCDKFCAFCVVPYTRGAEASRPLAAVLEDARRLAAAGVREVTLIGQNVNAYRGAAGEGAAGLADLIAAAARIEGLARIRYATSHPCDMGEALMAAHRDEPALMPYLHLPVQAGSDAVLAAMNRRHTADDYRRLIDMQRRYRPDIAVSSDFIVGFPGESEADFRATLRLVEEIGFASAFSFKYSERPGTPAADRAGQIPEAEKAARLAELQALLARQQRAFNAATVGRTVDVLFEKSGRHPGQIVGKSPYLQAVHVEAPAEWLGRIAPVRITGLSTNGLTGEIAGTETRGWAA